MKSLPTVSFKYYSILIFVFELALKYFHYTTSTPTIVRPESRYACSPRYIFDVN